MTIRKVTIGLPVYNGEKYLDGCIASLLAQDYSDYELIISDNASTDTTRHICQKYAQIDSRIKYIRHENNRGAAWNFNYVFDERSDLSKYFMWAAHDDLWEITYISQCVEELEKNPNAVTCGCDPCFINGEGRLYIQPGFSYNKLDTRGMPLRERVSELTKVINWYSIYSVVRINALKKTSLATEKYGSDVILLMELLLLGETLILKEKLFYYRIIPKTALQQMQDVSPKKANKLADKCYSNLCLSLLKIIDECDCQYYLKEYLKNDLIYNASCLNFQLRNLIILENTMISIGTYESKQASSIAKTFISCSDKGYMQILLNTLWIKLYQLAMKIKCFSPRLFYALRAVKYFTFNLTSHKP